MTDANFGKAMPCPECARGFLLQRKLDRLVGELPDMFREWTLESFPTLQPTQVALLTEARAWLHDPREPWLYLWGPSGRCKTGLSVGLLREALGRGASGALKVVPDLLARIRRTYRSNDDYEADESDLLDALYTADLLVLDDLGSEKVTDWTIEKIFQVIGGRHDNRKRTIITSNCDLESLADRLGHPRTTSRIGEMTGERWILNVSNLPNMRMKGA